MSQEGGSRAPDNGRRRSESSTGSTRPRRSQSCRNMIGPRALTEQPQEEGRVENGVRRPHERHEEDDMYRPWFEDTRHVGPDGFPILEEFSYELEDLEFNWGPFNRQLENPYGEMPDVYHILEQVHSQHSSRPKPEPCNMGHQERSTHEVQQQPSEADFENSTQPKSISDVVISDTDVLDCPICFYPLSPPVFQCVNGHLVCNSCSNKINNKCPSCSRPIGLNRCIAVEKILASAKVSCRNREHGCRERISYGEKLVHELSCKYNVCSCPHEGCNYTAVSNLLYMHFSAEHSSSVHEFRIDIPTVIRLTKDMNRVFLQERRGSTLFVLDRTILPQGSIISIMRIGPTSPGARNTYWLAVRAGSQKLSLKSYVVVAPKCSAQPHMRNCVLVTNYFANYLEHIELQTHILPSLE